MKKVFPTYPIVDQKRIEEFSNEYSSDKGFLDSSEHKKTLKPIVDEFYESVAMKVF